jgi:hypothetical protein
MNNALRHLGQEQVTAQYLVRILSWAIWYLDTGRRDHMFKHNCLYSGGSGFETQPRHRLSRRMTFLIHHHVIKAYWMCGGIAPRILDLSTRWMWVVSFTLQPLYPRERAPGKDWIGGWMDTTAGLDAAVKRKIPSLRRELNPKTPIVQPVAPSLCTETNI